MLCGKLLSRRSIAEAAIDSDREVSVTIEKKDKRIQATQYDLRHKNYTITFAPQDKEKATKALIFYPGGQGAVYGVCAADA